LNAPGRRGRFITLEGIEGAGKSTLVASLRAELERRGVTVEVTREPGGTPLAERLRAAVLERGAEIITPAAETLIMFAARSIHLENRIRPALERGSWVLCDRFTDATRAYQGAGRGVDARWIEGLAERVHGGCEPDRTLLLDLPVELGLARAAARRGAPDRFESERATFFERVRDGYLARARAEPRRVRILDASASAPQVLGAALEALSDVLSQRMP
jgi:dTMP kinase